MVTPNDKRLRAAGPIDTTHGYPMWFEDADGTRLELVLNDDPLAPVIGELPDPNAPLAFPDNFPDESFYYAVETQLPVGGAGVVGRARVILALEAAFGGAGSPAAGMNVVFARIRVRMDDMIPGAKYVVTHPYGVTTELEADDRGRVFHTEDLGLVEGDPSAVLRSGQVAPFLRGTTAAPAGYIGDGVTEQAITGSPFGTNHVVIKGPRIREGGGNPDPANPGSIDHVWTNLFTVQGRIARHVGASVTCATYDATGASPRLTVAAHSVPVTAGIANDLRVVGPNLHAKLDAQGEHHVAIIDAAAVPAPGAAKLYNFSDDPATAFDLRFTPALVVEGASHDLDTDTLTVRARCLDPAATLVLKAPSATLTTSPQVITGIGAAPATLELEASIGGTVVARERCKVVWSGTPSTTPPAVMAIAQALPASVRVATEVRLDGTASPGATGHAWSQVSGPPAALADAGTAVARFTPAAAGSYRFALTAQGSGGPATANVDVVATPPPGPDVITVLRAQYRTGRRQYLVEGSVDNRPNTIQVHLGGPGGPLVGEAKPDGVGDWRVRVTLSAAQAALVPGAGATLAIVGTTGPGTTTPLLIRN